MRRDEVFHFQLVFLLGTNPRESAADALEEYVLARQIGRRALCWYLAPQLGYLGLAFDANEAERDGLFDGLIERQVLVVLPEVLGQYVNVQVSELGKLKLLNTFRLISCQLMRKLTCDESGLLLSLLLVIISGLKLAFVRLSGTEMRISCA